ncbi:MAG: DUF1343 domain-containing protein [Gemmatimonadota bacterium]
MMQGLLSALGLFGWLLACAGAPGPADRVRPGLEVLIEDSLQLVQGKRVGLVSNQGSLDSRGQHAVERLRAAQVNLVALFTPEHGFRGTAAPGEAVLSTRDSATGIPIYSLYGRTYSPTDTMLAGIDILLVDLPDVGARYFTYFSTTIEVMRAAGRHGIPVLVLDRPDPIGGAVQGNLLDTAYRSFVGALAMPMRPGMTLGELARLAQSDLSITVSLTIIPVRGWHRSEMLDETGLPFIRPSPNLHTLESLFHYPGTCLFEGTNLSVGRGSDAPFEQVGAPWLDTAAVLHELKTVDLPGVEFRSVKFTPHAPGDAKYVDTALAGIRLHVTDREKYDPTHTAVVLLSIIRRLHPSRFRLVAPQFDRLAGGPTLRTALERGDDPQSIVAAWEPGLDQFKVRRRPFLLY